MYGRFVHFLSLLIFLLSLLRPVINFAKEPRCIIKVSQLKLFQKLIQEKNTSSQDTSKDQTQQNTQDEDYQDYEAVLRQEPRLSTLKGLKTNLWPRVIGALQDLVQSIHRPPSTEEA